VSRSTVGVIGHVDHGKTALVRALTGQDTDRLPQEKARGISIALGFAHLDDAVDLIDMPGHERFVRTMISGATGIDAVLLVVAANEGVRPQTVEHVEIAGLLGITRAIVAVSKCDLVSREDAEFVGAEAADLLKRNGLEPHPPILTSALHEQGMAALGIAELGQTLRALAERPRPGLGSAYLPIDRAFTVAGHGTVVTGTLRGGEVASGDALELLPRRRGLRVRAIQVHGESAGSARPGQRVALNLRGVAIGEVSRGMALVSPGGLGLSQWLTVALRSLEGAPPLRNGARLRALFGTSEAETRLRLLDRDVLEPGDAAFAQLRFAEPVAVPAGEHLVLRRASPALTLAGGRVLEPVTQRRKRHDGALLHRLEQLRDDPRSSHAEAVEGPVQGRPQAERRKPLTLPPDPERERITAEAAAQIAELLRAAGLTPPLPKEIIVDAPTHRAAEMLLREGTLIRAVDRDKGKELLFHRDAVASARAVLAPLLGEGLLVSEIAAALGVSRKFCMPLLDHLDTVRFTRRAGDRRVLGQALRADS
jgi:selenocysteine-specific elongation factor SelB